MAITILPDKIQIGNCTITFVGEPVSPAAADIDTRFGRIIFDNVLRAKSFVALPYLRTNAGYSVGGSGSPPPVNVGIVEKFPFASTSPTILTNDLTDGPLSYFYTAGVSSDTHAYFVYGSGTGVGSTAGRYFPFANESNRTGPVSSTIRNRMVGNYSTNYGYFSGGLSQGSPTPVAQSIIYRFPFSNLDSQSATLGDLTVRRADSAGQSSTEHGYVSGGLASTDSPFVGSIPSNLWGGLNNNVIDKFPFATTTNASDVGDLTIARLSCGGLSSTVSGYTTGGTTSTSTTPAGQPALPPGTSNVIDKFPFATDTNASDVGDLAQSRTRTHSTQSSATHGHSTGGYDATSPLTSISFIQRFPFATDTNTTVIGTLISAKGSIGGGHES